MLVLVPPRPPPPFLKLVTIMLEAWNLVRKYTHMFSFRKYTFWYQDPLNFADVSIHFSKISIFWQKYYLYSKQEYESCVGDFLALFSCFVRWKVTINENVRLKKYASGIWLPDGFKLALNWKKDNDVTIYQHFVIFIFFDIACYSCQVYLLVQVSCQYHEWFWNYDKLSDIPLSTFCPISGS